MVMEVAGTKQTAPYNPGEVDMGDKAAVQAADRNRYTFVNAIVKEVERREVLTKDTNMQDKIDEILTNKVAGILIFAAMMFGVFNLSQSTVGPAIADYLVGWIETFQGWVGEQVSSASPFMQALLITTGSVGTGFVPGLIVVAALAAIVIGLIKKAEGKAA